MNVLSKVFNWKKNPASVFWFALPLAFIGLGSQLLLAFIHIKQTGDYGFLLIWLFFAALGGFGIYRAYANHQRLRKMFDACNKR